MELNVHPPEDGGMTIEQYTRSVLRLGLRPTRVPLVYMSAQGNTFHVPEPGKLNPDQRTRMISRLAIMIRGFSD